MEIKNKEPLQSSSKFVEIHGNDKKYENDRDLLDQLNRKKFGTIRHSLDGNTHS